MRTELRSETHAVAIVSAIRVSGVKLSDFIEDPELNCTTNIKCTEMMGDVDGVQTALSTPDQLSGLWFSRVKSPGRELPDNEFQMSRLRVDRCP